MSTQTQRQTLRIGHSPDPDDAFMWYPLANFPNGSGPGGKTYTPRIDTGRYDFVHVLEDIESLNQRAMKKELEITAVSIHQYPYIADHYALTSCGASMGDGYGPMVIASKAMTVNDLKAGMKLAIPGERTSAHLALQLMLGKDAYDYDVVMFDEIIPAVVSGKYDAGLIIHEGQLTYAKAGLSCVVDLGKWWTDSRKLPLPLGGNCIARDLGNAMGPICKILYDSISYALANRKASIDYALNYARDMGADLADRFVGMYVNQTTLDYGQAGQQAVALFLKEGAQAGIIPDIGQVDFVEPMALS